MKTHLSGSRIRRLVAAAFAVASCCSVLPSVAFAQYSAPVWAIDSFDRRPAGPLGFPWMTTAPDQVPVVTGTNFGKILNLKPSGGTNGLTYSTGRGIPAQSSGTHVLQFRVWVGYATTASIGKIELNNSNASFNKAFQIYFGSTGMRVNNGPSTVIFSSPGPWQGYWHDVRCEIDMSTMRVDIYVDATLQVWQFSMGAGYLTGISLYGWDYRAGYLYVDDIIGYY
jgi:hypothetical protein